LDAFGLTIHQPAKGYRFSVDPLLLCAFAGGAEALAVADLGTGCGVIPLVMARRLQQARIVGVEFQPDMAETARRNVLDNGLEERVSILETDILLVRGELPRAAFDLVLANPPYRRRGSGRQSPTAGRDLARHESSATMEDFLDVAKYLVRPGGRVAFVFLASRLGEFMAAATGLKMVPLRLQFVHGAPGMEAKVFLCELTVGRGGSLAVLPPLVLRDEQRHYTPRAIAVMEGRAWGGE
jgi:tRNA1Val (adenine37-N6)-methyltransferase